MRAIWSPRRKFEMWRSVWVALARAQAQLGLGVTQDQVRELESRRRLTDDDFRRAAEHEKRLKHDVMGHVHAYGEAAPGAAGVIHLGMTSQDVVCNADGLIMREALALIVLRTARVIDALGTFAERWKATPALGFTHYQPAQPTTVGRRAAQWGYDLSIALDRLEQDLAGWRLRGLKGATGTQASFLALLDGDEAKVQRLEETFLRELAGPGDPAAAHLLTGQTYPRVDDALVLSDLAAPASVVHKMCNDIRLLSNRKELDEPFGDEQIGSSAMPYKRNPMRCERVTGLCRFVMSMPQNGLDTAATQWLERTLDDSSNRRLVLPESFLALDGALDTLHSVAAGLVVHEASVRKNLMDELPFMASENLMMAATKLGRDRQAVHEAIRRHAQEAGRRVKDQGLANDLIDRLRGEPLLAGVDVAGALSPEAYVGLSVQQVERFVRETVEPIRRRHGAAMAALPSSEPAV